MCLVFFLVSVSVLFLTFAVFCFSQICSVVVLAPSDAPFQSLSLMEQLTENLASRLDLTAGETDLLAADPKNAIPLGENQALSLIGRVVTDRELSINFIRPNVTRLLRPVKGIDLKVIDTNLFVIKFEHLLDRKKAMKGCPWVLDKYALILEPIDPSKKHADHLLTKLPIMVRIPQLSLANRSEHVAALIGNSLGWFVDLPKSQDGFYTPYFRFQILVDITQPLKRGVNFHGVDGVKQWLQVVYERLPFFCFLCGIIGHGEEDCPLRYEEGFTEPTRGLPYGSWMRANDDSRRSLGMGSGATRSNQSWGRAVPSSQLGKKGTETFAFNSTGGRSNKAKENWEPNLLGGIGRSDINSWRRDEGEGSVNSSASIQGGRPQRIRIASHKRKATDGKGGENVAMVKKPMLRLRDEDQMDTAAAAEQSRRSP